MAATMRAYISSMNSGAAIVVPALYPRTRSLWMHECTILVYKLHRQRASRLADLGMNFA
jgi:hypothetical protein